MRRHFRPPGLVIAVCGVDGSGKSTVIPRLVEALQATFDPANGLHLHWKPRVFRNSGEGQPNPDPHGKPPRPTVVSMAYFGFHVFEFFVGWFLRIQPVVARGGLVILDRYYYDFFVDQRRYRLRVPLPFVRAGYRIVRKPDVVFLLDAPAEVLQARKQEVPLEETRRQRNAFLELIRGLPNGVVVDAAQSPDFVVAEMSRHILRTVAMRAGNRGL